MEHSGLVEEQLEPLKKTQEEVEDYLAANLHVSHSNLSVHDKLYMDWNINE